MASASQPRAHWRTAFARPSRSPTSNSCWISTKLTTSWSASPPTRWTATSTRPTKPSAAAPSRSNRGGYSSWSPSARRRDPHRVQTGSAAGDRHRAGASAGGDMDSQLATCGADALDLLPALHERAGRGRRRAAKEGTAHEGAVPAGVEHHRAPGAGSLAPRLLVGEEHAPLGPVPRVVIFDDHVHLLGRGLRHAHHHFGDLFGQGAFLVRTPAGEHLHDHQGHALLLT